MYLDFRQFLNWHYNDIEAGTKSDDTTVTNTIEKKAVYIVESICNVMWYCSDFAGMYQSGLYYVSQLYI